MELVSSETLRWLRAQSPGDKDKWGPIVWRTFHGVAAAIPCDGCRSVAVRVLRGFHDSVNVELRKPVRYPLDMAYASFFIGRAVSDCRAMGGNCPVRASCNVSAGCVAK